MVADMPVREDRYASKLPARGMSGFTLTWGEDRWGLPGFWSRDDLAEGTEEPDLSHPRKEAVRTSPNWIALDRHNIELTCRGLGKCRHRDD